MRKGDKGEYGLATLELDDDSDPLFAGLAGPQQIWMSHRDVVGRLPEGFSVVGRTDTCAVAAIASSREEALRPCSFTPRWSTLRAGMRVPGELRVSASAAA